MAKKRRAPTKSASFEVASGIANAESQPKQPTDRLEAPTTEDRLEEFAEDLGRLLGTAKVKAQGWMNQRTAITEHLTVLRDTANQLLSQLGVGVPAKRGRKPGRPRKDQHFTAPPDKVAPPKKRTMSPEAREKIAAAQRKRWAKQKRVAAKD